MEALNKFLSIHKNSKDKLRLGQRFCCMFVKESFTELFYEEDDNESILLIMAYLDRYQYTKELPQLINRNL